MTKDTEHAAFFVEFIQHSVQADLKVRLYRRIVIEHRGRPSGRP
jgi:hypothetical protein